MWRGRRLVLKLLEAALQNCDADSLQRGDTMSNNLKSIFACSAAVTFIVAASIATFSSAKAAPLDFCRDYATAAVRQVQLTRSIPACNRGTGPRWTSDYRVHFDWCIGADPGAVEAERNARTNWIRSCRGM